MGKITLVGYGNQGKAWAANLRDSGWEVQVSGRPAGVGMGRACKDGFATLPASELRNLSGAIALLLPDESISSFFLSSSSQLKLRRGLLLFPLASSPGPRRHTSAQNDDSNHTQTACFLNV